jgi:hypothetical protein
MIAFPTYLSNLLELHEQLGRLSYLGITDPLAQMVKSPNYIYSCFVLTNWGFFSLLS